MKAKAKEKAKEAATKAAEAAAAHGEVAGKSFLGKIKKEALYRGKWVKSLVVGKNNKVS